MWTRITAALIAAALVASGCGNATSAATTASPSATPNCSSADVGNASASLQGGAGSAVGQIRVDNTGAGACVLRGAPLVRLYTAGGALLPVRNIGRAAQSGHHIVVAPGSSAVSRLQWGNGCHLPGNATKIEIDWPGGRTSTPLTGLEMPRCDAPSLKSHVASSFFTAG